MSDEKKIDLHNFNRFLTKLASKEEKYFDEIIRIRKNQQLKYKKIYHKILQSKELNLSDIQTYSHENLDTTEDIFKEFQNHLPIILREDEKKVLNNYYSYHIYEQF